MVSSVFGFCVKKVDVTVKEGRVFAVYLAYSFGNIKLTLFIAWVEDTEVLSVSRDNNYKMASHSKKTCLALGNKVLDSGTEENIYKSIAKDNGQ